MNVQCVSRKFKPKCGFCDDKLNYMFIILPIMALFLFINRQETNGLHYVYSAALTYMAGIHCAVVVQMVLNDKNIRNSVISQRLDL